MDLGLYYVQLTFIANMHGLLLQKIKKELHLLMLFRKCLINQNPKQIKYGLIKTANVIIDQWEYWLEKNDIEMYSTHKENHLLLKHSLEPYKTKFINTWLQFLEMYTDKLEDLVNKYNNNFIIA